MSFTQPRRVPQDADLAIHALADIEQYTDEILGDYQQWLEAFQNVQDEGDQQPQEGQPGSFRTVFSAFMADEYSKVIDGLIDQTSRRGKVHAQHLLGLFALSNLWSTEEFWAGAGDQATTTGEEWDAGIDMAEAGHPHVHYPSEFVARTLGALPVGEDVQWYRNEAGLYLAVQQSTLEPTTHTMVTPYLPSAAALRRADG